MHLLTSDCVSYSLFTRSSLSEWWIGQNDQSSDYVYKYLDDPAGCGVFLDWQSGQPNGGVAQPCIAFQSAATNPHAFQDKACTESSYRALCKAGTWEFILHKSRVEYYPMNGKFLKKLAEDQCSAKTKGSIYSIKHMYIEPFTIEVD